MSNTSKIKCKPYRNWVRGALGLFYLQEGLYPFTDRVVEAEHARIVQNLTPCANCAIENILPVHASGKICIQKNKGKCNCRKRANNNCPTCSKIYDDIVLQHRFREPHWVTDCSTWYNDHWQVAKCFLTTTSKGSNNTAAETDASGLLSIIINGEFFQSEIHANIDPPNDIFSQAREMRNEILHNSTLDLTDQKVTGYLQSMIAVLEDKKVLSSDPAAQAAAIKLKEILQDDLIVTTTEEARAIQTALDVIRVAKEQSEESIKKLQEESRISLQQQTLDSATEIKAAKEGAMEEVASTVSREFKQTYEPEIKTLKLGHEDHENRLRAVEEEQQNLKSKQFELEEHVAKLKIIEGKYQMKIEYLKQKQDLQEYLVDVYQKHYVKTSISPLMTQQNDVNISDVYVSPNMVVEEKDDGNDGNIIKFGKRNKTKNKRIESYRDLFWTNEKRNRKIFIVGDVGTGKSSFCKMIIQNWCSSIIKRRQIGKSDAMDKEKFDKFDMSQFDFLFYIPLSNMSGRDDTVDMIKSQFEEHYVTTVDDIFTNDSERCLILADGLDEWTPPKLNRQLLHHITAEIPTSHSARECTIVTASRPSSRGILNMKSSDYDLKVILLGLDEDSVQPMIEKYMKLFNNTSAISDCKAILLNLTFKDICNAPMLLQQIIWLYCKGYDIGKSRSFIYTNIVNIVLAWGFEKSNAAAVLHDFQCSSLEHLSLPTVFDTLERCQENRTLLLLLGTIAYDAYITDNTLSPVFGRYKMKQLGLSDDDISAILRTGILTEVICADPTHKKSQLSFIHTSYVEFFASLYICTWYLWKISDAHFSGTPLALLENLTAITPKTSFAEILRLKNVLIMICGLESGLTEHVCECIYKVTLDEGIDEGFNSEKLDQIQRLTFDCLSEHYSVNQEIMVKFKLRHLYMLWDAKRFEKSLSGLDPTNLEACTVFCPRLSHQQNLLLSSVLSQAVSLRTLNIQGMYCTKNECESHTIDLTNHLELQSIELKTSKISVSGINQTFLRFCEFSYCRLSHEQCSLISLFLSQAVSLRALKIYSIDCTKDECEGHFIDLTNHTEFLDIDLSDSKISVSGVNHTCLQSCEISDCGWSHEQCSLLSLFLSQAVSLRTLKIYGMYCTKDECHGHCIDLTNHTEFQGIELSMSIISVSGINHTCLQFCKISYYELSHEQCSFLSSFLSQAVSLRTLAIKRTKCSQDECEGHTIDLSDHTELQSIELSDSQISVSGINHTCLQYCKISDCELTHEQYSLLSSFLSQSVSLRTLEIEYIACKKGECEGHTIELTIHKQLQSIVLSWSKVYVSGISHTCLGSCKISGYELSHEQCLLLSSSLSQLISLRTLEIEDIKCTKHECEGHIIDLTKHTELHSIMSSKSKISVSGINHTCPQFCKFSHCEFSHEQCTLLSSYLSQAVSLRTLDIEWTVCAKDECEGHSVDLSNHTELKSIKLSNSKISVSGVNHCLESCVVSHCELTHEQCSLLSSFLSQAISLRTLEVVDINCTTDEFEGHMIDLTNHRELKKVTLLWSKIYASGINPTLSLSCSISYLYCNLFHKHCASLCSFLSHAESLYDLELHGIECIEDACEGHNIDLANHKQLKRLYISNCKAISILIRNCTCLRSCTISNCHLSHEHCASLCSSLSHAESLDDLKLHGIECIEDACEGHDIDLTNHKQLNRLSISNCKTISISSKNSTCLRSCEISNNDCSLSHEILASLCSFLSHADPLHDLELHGIECIEDACEGHAIDLTNHKQLDRLSMSNCKTIYITSRNSTCLISCKISNSNCGLSHEICASLCSFLSHADPLYFLELHGIECIEDACEGHDIDLTNHKQLNRLSISNCKKIYVTSRSSTCPIWCTISNSYYGLSHELCASLRSFLSHAESLYDLKLQGIKCIEDRCAGHVIDLTNLKQLKRLTMSNCKTISITSRYSTCLRSCNISNTYCDLSHEHCVSLCTFLSNAQSLYDLELQGIECIEDRCPGHDIDLTNHEHLKDLSVSNCNTISFTGIGINPTFSRVLSH